MRNIINQLMNWGHNGSEQRNSQLGLSLVEHEETTNRESVIRTPLNLNEVCNLTPPTNSNNCKQTTLRVLYYSVFGIEAFMPYPSLTLVLMVIFRALLSYISLQVVALKYRELLDDYTPACATHANGCDDDLNKKTETFNRTEGYAIDTLMHDALITSIVLSYGAVAAYCTIRLAYIQLRRYTEKDPLQYIQYRLYQALQWHADEPEDAADYPIKLVGSGYYSTSVALVGFFLLALFDGFMFQGQAAFSEEYHDQLNKQKEIQGTTEGAAESEAVILTISELFRDLLMYLSSQEILIPLAAVILICAIILFSVPAIETLCLQLNCGRSWGSINQSTISALKNEAQKNVEDFMSNDAELMKAIKQARNKSNGSDRTQQATSYRFNGHVHSIDENQKDVEIKRAIKREITNKETLTSVQFFNHHNDCCIGAYDLETRVYSAETKTEDDVEQQRFASSQEELYNALQDVLELETAPGEEEQKEGPSSRYNPPIGGLPLPGLRSQGLFQPTPNARLTAEQEAAYRRAFEHLQEHNRTALSEDKKITYLTTKTQHSRGATNQTRLDLFDHTTVDDFIDFIHRAIAEGGVEIAAYSSSSHHSMRRIDTSSNLGYQQYVMNLNAEEPIFADPRRRVINHTRNSSAGL